MNSDLNFVVARLNDTFPDGPPTDRAVREMASVVLKRQWVAHWPDGLTLPALLQGDDATTTITRATMLRAGRRCRTPDDAVELFVMVSGWARPGNARGTWRACRVLHEPDAAERLLTITQSSNKCDPVEVFERLSNPALLKIKYLGPSSFTKLMYAAGFVSRTGRRQPLIFDDPVHRAVRNLSMTTDAYHEYLGLVADLGHQWAPGAPLDVVEHALGVVGRRVGTYWWQLAAEDWQSSLRSSMAGGDPAFGIDVPDDNRHLLDLHPGESCPCGCGQWLGGDGWVDEGRWNPPERWACPTDAAPLPVDADDDNPSEFGTPGLWGHSAQTLDETTGRGLRVIAGYE